MVIDLGHLSLTELPLALAEAHRALATGSQVSILLSRDLGGEAQLDLVSDVINGAGFAVSDVTVVGVSDGQRRLKIAAERLWSLPDYVGVGMQLLMCGLNPSPGSADAGVGFHRAGNRFWPAAIAAGLVSGDREPGRALLDCHIGMTDMVKRPTRRADELDSDEYKAGFERITRLVEWLQPGAICMVGLAGWRAAVDRKAQRGWQPQTLGGRPVYLMPSTSGLNAHDTIDTLTAHLIAASEGQPSGSACSAAD